MDGVVVQLTDPRAMLELLRHYTIVPRDIEPPKVGVQAQNGVWTEIRWLRLCSSMSLDMPLMFRTHDGYLDVHLDKVAYLSMRVSRVYGIRDVVLRLS